MIKKRFRIYGHVQGVGFRYFTWQYALKIGVTGFVRNLAVRFCGSYRRRFGKSN